MGRIGGHHRGRSATGRERPSLPGSAQVCNVTISGNPEPGQHGSRASLPCWLLFTPVYGRTAQSRFTRGASVLSRACREASVNRGAFESDRRRPSLFVDGLYRQLLIGRGVVRCILPLPETERIAKRPRMPQRMEHDAGPTWIPHGISRARLGLSSLSSSASKPTV